MNSENRSAYAAICYKALLGFCVFVSGASIMVLQFIVVRILTRDFGGSLEVWAAVISVCLAGISLGYYLGGYLADRFQSWRMLGFMLVLGGTSGACVEMLANVAGQQLLQVDFALTWHPYFAALFSSFLPNLMLGTILPQAIKLGTHELARVGKSVGRIAALSEVGSIFGVILTAQVLIVYLGVRESLYATAFVLILFGIVLISAGNRLRLCTTMSMLFIAFGSYQAQAQIVFEKYSSYHHIIVEDISPHRLLRFNRDIQSTMSLEIPYAGGFEYTDFFHVPLVLHPTMDRVLFVGLGGGTGPKDFLAYYPEMQVDVVEIDPMVINVAKEFFAVPEHPRLSIYEQDGRNFLRRSSNRYGAIIVDAYASGGPYGAYLPYHLATKEFFEAAASQLITGGAVVFNAIGNHGGMNADVIRDVHTTMRSVFHAVYVFQAQTSINTVFVAVKIDVNDIDEDGLVGGKHWPEGPWLSHLATGDQLRTMVNQLAQSGHMNKPHMVTRVNQFSRAHTRGVVGTILTDNQSQADRARRN